MSREEANARMIPAAQAYALASGVRPEWMTEAVWDSHYEFMEEALAAADGYDSAHGIRRISSDDLQAIRDDSWQRGYEACREGKQKHSPYRAS